MKKVLLLGITAMLLALVIISSCKKSSNGDQVGNWICHCSVSTTASTYIRNIPEDNQTQNDANTACAQVQTSYTSPTSSASCQLQQ